MFTTVEDDETSVRINILNGGSKVASECGVLGSFDLSGIPPAKEGVPQIMVTLTVGVNGLITATAVESDERRHAAWKQAGGALIAR